MNESKVKTPSNAYLNILTIYLVLTVVNWLPVISSGMIRNFKYILFIYIFYYEINHSKFRFPSLYLSPIGLMLILLSMSLGLFLSPDINAVVDIVLPFVIIWIFNFEKEFYYKAIYKASIVIAFICVLSIGASLTGIFNLVANGPWNSTFGQAAFAGYRTGYSNSLFLFVPFLVFWHRRKSKGFFSIETFAIFAIIIAQYFSGGRAGLIASLLVFLIGYKFSIIYKVIIVVMMIPFTQSEEFLIQMRLVNPYGEEIDEDQITSGRIGLTDIYYTKFIERPFFGFGFGEKSEIDEMTVHIVWLKNAVNGGLFYALFLLGIFVSIFINVMINRIYLSNEEVRLFLSLFFISFLITFLEPNYLIGSVQGEIVYWLIMSLLLKKQLTHAIEQKSDLAY